MRRRASLLVLLLLQLAALAAAGKGGCTARATWPDGREEERECIVEGVDKERASSKGRSGNKKVSSEFAWMKDTRWLWNNWREVIFLANGSFLAPAENCEADGNPACKWWSDDDRVYVSFGGAGMHTLTVNDDRTMLHGARDSDGDEVQAERR